jgi:hypothetical protein
MQSKESAMTAQKQKTAFILPMALSIVLGLSTLTDGADGPDGPWTGFGDNVGDPADLTPMMLDNPVAASAIHLPASPAPIESATPAPAAGLGAPLAATGKCSAVNPCAVVAPARGLAPERHASAARL